MRIGGNKDQEQIDEIFIAMHNEGKSIDEIMAALEMCSRSTYYRYIARLGLEHRTKAITPEEQRKREKQFVEMYNAGKSIEVIRKTLHISMATFYNYVNRLGLGRRGRPSQNPRPAEVVTQADEELSHLTFAKHTPPQRKKVVIKGKTYWDVTDFFLYSSELE